MAKRTEFDLDTGTRGAAEPAMPFCRMLVAIDESASAEAAVGLVAEWVDGPGADVRFVQVSEERRQRRSAAGPAVGLAATEQAHQLVIGAPTLGARNRLLVHGIAQAAEDFGADVIVLGIDRPRLAGHRLAPSLREQIMRATDLPVLVAPSPQPDGRRQHRLLPDLHHDQDRAHDAPGYAHV